jgi:Domain of Unknown Function with PDB structure (DUF3857)/Transglutaminase-like superfamily
MIKKREYALSFLLPAFFLLAGLAAEIRAEDAPTWLRQAASVTPPTYDKDVPAVVLHDEEQVTLNNDGKIVTVDNYAVRPLTREGRKFAVARAFYLVSSGKVREITAWVIRPDGTTKYYDKKTVLDLIADKDDVYNEGRVKMIDASGDVDIGYVFGYTSISEDTPLFYQDQWSFQSRLPTLVSRYSLNLPSGWKATSITFNAPDINPQISGSAYTWELRNLPPIPPEPLSPGVSNLTPRVAINYAPENKTQSANQTFANWTDVSRWGASLHDPQVVIDDNIAQKARDLTANSPTELEKIQAVGNYVQNLQYIAIDIGVGHGNGYRPRSSALVLGRGYGDCKDKANLMRALLKVLKIDAYPIAIFSGDPRFVREQWASPRQFNHCILAVKVSDLTKAATIIDNEKLGRLLIFDATDPYTPVGDLPDYLQDSLALIIAGDSGGLVRMPVNPPEADLLERNVEATLTSTGEIRANIHERARGQAATFFRHEFRELSTPDYRKAIEGWLTHGATGATLDELKPNDSSSEGRFNLDVNFSVANYGQLMQGRLLIFKPIIVGRRNSTYLTENKRTNPVEIDSSAMRETAVFTLPEGFTVDEIPPAANFETSFGKYKSTCEVNANKLTFKREMVLNRAVLPVEKYSTAKDFFSKIRDAEQVPVVLVKK